MHSAWHVVAVEPDRFDPGVLRANHIVGEAVADHYYLFCPDARELHGVIENGRIWFTDTTFSRNDDLLEAGSKSVSLRACLAESSGRR